MNHPAHRRRLAFPGWEVGPVAVGLGLIAHVVSGGAPPGPAVLTGLTALLSMCASLIARIGFPTWLLLVFSAVSQQMLHLAFDRLSGTFTGVVPSQHQHAAAVLQNGQLTAAPSAASGHSPDLMLDTHVAAALLTVLLIAKADTLMTRVWALLHRPGSGDPPRLVRS